MVETGLRIGQDKYIPDISSDSPTTMFSDVHKYI